MNEHELRNSPDGLTRRELLRSVVGATTLSVPLMWPGWLSAPGGPPAPAAPLANALHHHGDLLDASTRRQWTERLVRATKFLDGFLTIESGNINYPVTGAYCFAICGQVLDNSRYLARARELAHATLEYFTQNGLLFGEGHPQTAVTKKKCRPVDLGYNVEESLPSLALYALATNDEVVLERVVTSLRTHMEFMMPDVGWDNS